MIQTMLKKESLVGGSKSAKGDPYPLADLDHRSKSAGGPNPLWHRHVKFASEVMINFLYFLTENYNIFLREHAVSEADLSSISF